MRTRAWPVAAVLGLAVACGGGGGGGVDDDPLLRTGETPVTASSACRDSFVQGHNLETSGGSTPEVFRPSVEACGSLAEWTAAARSGRVNLTGRDARFVSEVCRVSEDPALQARPICREATAEAAKAGA
ncbi:MAG: hypothetical protein M3O23_09130 [Actinomycetota bacterium]|nr:hypothetical protein [Actinomycetota bacterium]